MKNTLILTAMLALSACALPTLTFDQQVALVCSNANAAISIVSDDGLFSGGAQETLTKDIQPAISKVCSSGALVTATSLQGIANDSVPALKALVAGSTISTQGKADANTAIDLIAAAVNDAIVLAPTVTPTAAASEPAAQ